MSLRPLDILVAGAGVGGLAATIALTLAGHRVRLIDRFSAPRPLGSGLVVQPVGQRVLDWLGAGEAARHLGQKIAVLHGIEAPSGAGTLNVRYDHGAPGRHGLGLHRAALFSVLHDRMRALGVTVQTDCEVTGQRRDAQGQWLTLAAGARLGPVDLVVDALGAHSPLSGMVSRNLPYGALWTSLRWPEGCALPSDRLSQRYRAARQMVGVLPIGRLPDDPTPRAAFFWSLRGDAVTGWRDAGLAVWKDQVLALWPQAAPFVAQISAPEDLAFARYAHGTLNRPFAEGVVHVGDSAHRTSPQLGQGANMALLDALALARALDMLPLTDALPAYARMRRWHLRLYQAASLFLTPQYQHDSAAMAVLRDRIVAPLARLWPMPRVMGAIASGLIVPPLAGEPHARGLPVPPHWAHRGPLDG